MCLALGDVRAQTNKKGKKEKESKKKNDGSWLMLSEISIHQRSGIIHTSPLHERQKKRDGPEHRPAPNGGLTVKSLIPAQMRKQSKNNNPQHQFIAPHESKSQSREPKGGINRIDSAPTSMSHAHSALSPAFYSPVEYPYVSSSCGVPLHPGAVPLPQPLSP